MNPGQLDRDLVVRVGTLEYDVPFNPRRGFEQGLYYQVTIPAGYHVITNANPTDPGGILRMDLPFNGPTNHRLSDRLFVKGPDPVIYTAWVDERTSHFAPLPLLLLGYLHNTNDGLFPEGWCPRTQAPIVLAGHEPVWKADYEYLMGTGRQPRPEDKVWLDERARPFEYPVDKIHHRYTFPVIPR